MEQHAPAPFNCPSASAIITSLTQKVVKARAHMKKMKFEGENSSQKYRYAKLDAIYDAVLPALQDVGVNIFHYKQLRGDQLYLVTRLVCQDTQQYIEDIDIIAPEKPGSQAKQSCVTYLKKSAVLSLCAVASAEDDDQEDEQAYINERDTKQPPITSEQVAMIKAAIKMFTNSVALYNAVLRRHKVNALEHLRHDQFEAVMQQIQQEGKTE